MTVYIADFLHFTAVVTAGKLAIRPSATKVSLTVAKLPMAMVIVNYGVPLFTQNAQAAIRPLRINARQILFVEKRDTLLARGCFSRAVSTASRTLTSDTIPLHYFTCSLHYSSVFVVAKIELGLGSSTLPYCDTGEDYVYPFCYPKCEEGFTGIGPVCWQVSTKTVRSSTTTLATPY